MDKKWRRVISGNFIELINILNEKDVNKLLAEENLDWIQINQNIDHSFPLVTF